MKFGVIINAGGPRAIAQLAAEAESASWDGVFTYDAIDVGVADTYDPWVILAGMAMRTERVRLGAMVFAPTRRRPWKLAREALTLDHLSAGRLVLPVGLGALDDRGFGGVGEVTDTRARAAILDETLAILDGLASGEPSSFDGTHYQMDSMTLTPGFVQQPRMPIWVVGAWPHPRSVQRALRWDGIIPQVESPSEYGDVARYVAEHRPAPGGLSPFEIDRRRVDASRSSPRGRDRPAVRRCGCDVVDRGRLEERQRRFHPSPHRFGSSRGAIGAALEPADGGQAASQPGKGPSSSRGTGSEIVPRKWPSGPSPTKPIIAQLPSRRCTTRPANSSDTWRLSITR